MRLRRAASLAPATIDHRSIGASVCALTGELLLATAAAAAPPAAAATPTATAPMQIVAAAIVAANHGQTGRALAPLQHTLSPSWTVSSSFEEGSRAEREEIIGTDRRSETREPQANNKRANCLAGCCRGPSCWRLNCVADDYASSTTSTANNNAGAC